MAGTAVLGDEQHERVRARLEAAGVPGAALATVTADGTVTAAAFGVADAATGAPVTTATAFHLFSATKLYTAAAVVRLAEQGRLDLDDRVSDHLPSVELAHPVTLRHLLTHTSGLKDTLKAFVAAHPADEPAPSTGAALARYRLDRAEPPGREVAYRNVNFALLGEVVSVGAGCPYDEFVAVDLLAPLGSGAGFVTTDAMGADLAVGHLGRWDPMRLGLRLLLPGAGARILGRPAGRWCTLRDFGLDSAAIGGLVGSVLDFVPFLAEFLQEGDGVLRRASRDEMLTLQAEGSAGIVSTVGTGLGWKAGAVDSVRFWNHEGGGPGFATETRLYPDAGVGFVLLMNRTHTKALSILAHDVAEELRPIR